MYCSKWQSIWNLQLVTLCLSTLASKRAHAQGNQDFASSLCTRGPDQSWGGAARVRSYRASGLGTDRVVLFR